MNVSVLIYLGNIGDNACWIGSLGFVIFVIAIAATIVYWVALAPSGATNKDAAYISGVARRARAIAWPVCIALWMLAFFLPSKSTMYAIAAAGVAEQVAKSELANDAALALQSWIKKQIEPAKMD